MEATSNGISSPELEPLVAPAVQTDVLIIGAGVIGLAVGRELANRYQVVVLEQASSFGQGISSRNSEVIHSGIYYPENSTKTLSCLRGRELLYEFAALHGVPHLKCGKYVVACGDGDEAQRLHRLEQHARSLGVPVLRTLPSSVAKVLPGVSASAALFLPETGIIDSHQLMSALRDDFTSRGGLLAPNHCFRSAVLGGKSWQSEVLTPEGELTIESAAVVNCAGLAAAEISNQLLAAERFQHRLCSGRYFTYHSRSAPPWHSLVYPLPEAHGLGIHATVDLAGGLRFGPDVAWLEGLTPNFDVDWELLRPEFGRAIRRYYPALIEEELVPQQVGIRPKLFVEGEPFTDFYLAEERGMIQCLGIESPGLTACLAIAERVGKFL